MSYSERQPRVFVSSTSEDLRDYRAVARLVILDLHCAPEMMEHFGALPARTVEACQEVLRQCDIMILLVAFRRGWVPTVEQGGNGQDSITKLELDFARKHEIPVLVMLASETWPGNLWEDESAARAWMKQFRAELNQPAAFFDFEASTTEEAKRLPAFRARLKEALMEYRERVLRKRTPAVSTTGLENLESAIEMFRSGACIPFLGPGIYGMGPLCPGAILQALGDTAPPESSLATVAEFREHHLRSRAAFLGRLTQILEEQMRSAQAPAVHEALLRLKPHLIVSATPDLLLEERLAREGSPPLILCHVIRSHDNEHDGKVLMFRGPDDSKPDICPADGIVLSAPKSSSIVYKPLGSPFLNSRLSPELQIDTVVMTEADHLVFLGRLETQSTGIPTAFSLYFQQYPFIFLGYPMDVWHYRLVLQLFQSFEAAARGPTSLAVRVPSSPLEERAWHWLNVDLVSMEPNEFASKAFERPGWR